MDRREEIRKELEALLKPYTSRTKNFSEDVRILHDLGIGGDDADEVLEPIIEKFGTNFEGFDFTEYFPAENEMMAEKWLLRLGFENSRRPLRIGHLIDVIELGAWFEPPLPLEPQTPPSSNRWRRYAVRGAVVLGMPICWTLIAVAIGEYGFGLSPGLSFLLFGIPAGAFFAIHMWRRLPVN